MRYFLILALLLLYSQIYPQSYYYGAYPPFRSGITAPSDFLGYPIGDYHTRHDKMVEYFRMLDLQSKEALLIEYGKSHEGRPLVMLAVSSAANLSRLEEIRQNHANLLSRWDQSVADQLPLVINLGYNVHGNEPSTSEAALLTAYSLVASDHPLVKDVLAHSIVFIDPAINPDGRDRHSQWANMYRSKHLVADADDAEHNENWPRGRGNHYWFDLNRDWLLAIHPESRAKLKWTHQWYPNVTGDFHEMGTQSSFFFEPMKTNGSKDPIMPKENYTSLNEHFGSYFARAMDSIGALYFTKEVFDGTYPGYGSSYGDLQGGLALLFEQASSRGHVQETAYGDLPFSFTIRNQYVAGMATLQAAVGHRHVLRKYQYDFFSGSVQNASRAAVKAYTFPLTGDAGRMAAFVDKLLIHKVKLHFSQDKKSVIVPTAQPQYRMVQTFFETYREYRDSVFYDASAWSVANFYNIKYKSLTSVPSMGAEITSAEELTSLGKVVSSQYAYILPWEDLSTAPAVYALQRKGLVLATALRPFAITDQNGKNQQLGYGAIVLPVAKQSVSADSVFQWVSEVAAFYKIRIISVSTGYSLQGIDLGSRHIQTLEKAKVALLTGDGTSSNEAGEVWFHLDQRLGVPAAKIALHRLRGVNLDKYNTLVMVSGSYNSLDSTDVKRLQSWVAKGNTFIGIGSAVTWAIRNKLVKEQLTEGPKKEKNVVRKPFAQADELLGKESLGGALFRVQLDRTHPIGFGYVDEDIAVYKNNTVWLRPSSNPFSTVTAYAASPHVDGYISPGNLQDFMATSASCVVSPVGRGRAVLFADNPLFRGTMYGTDRMFTNALLFGRVISMPAIPEEE